MYVYSYQYSKRELYFQYTFDEAVRYLCLWYDYRNSMVEWNCCQNNVCMINLIVCLNETFVYTQVCLFKKQESITSRAIKYETLFFENSLQNCQFCQIEWVWKKEKAIVFFWILPMLLDLFQSTFECETSEFDLCICVICMKSNNLYYTINYSLPYEVTLYSTFKDC